MGIVHKSGFTMERGALDAVERTLVPLVWPLVEKGKRRVKKFLSLKASQDLLLACKKSKLLRLVND